MPTNTTIHIIGEGEENEYLKDLSVKLNISNRVIFYGKITNEITLKGLFRQAYAYISPGPVGLGVLHSFAYGVPVLHKKRGNMVQNFTI